MGHRIGHVGRKHSGPRTANHHLEEFIWFDGAGPETLFTIVSSNLSHSVGDGSMGGGSMGGRCKEKSRTSWETIRRYQWQLSFERAMCWIVAMRTHKQAQTRKWEKAKVANGCNEDATTLS